MAYNWKFIIYIILFFLLSACGEQVQKQPDKLTLKIAVTKGKGSKGSLQYGKWLHSIDSNLIVYDLYYAGIDSALKLIHDCDGILVSGGADVHPNRYGEDYDSSRCEETDLYRDSLEFAVINYALQHKIPLLGICRGEQILNVYMGGSLYQDIPTDVPQNVGHRRKPIDSNFHRINILSHNFLYDICKVDSGMANSSHHQAIKKLGKGLEILARTNDSIPEAISWSDTDGKSFLLAVQWHPEWLGKSNPLSYPIGNTFLKEARRYHKLKSQNE